MSPELHLSEKAVHFPEAKSLGVGSPHKFLAPNRPPCPFSWEDQTWSR